jgi:hypothetical protein
MYVLMVEPSILQYRLQKDQQLLKEVVDFLLIRSKFLPRHVSAYGCHPQGVDIWNVLINIHYFLEDFLVFLQTEHYVCVFELHLAVKCSLSVAQKCFYGGFMSPEAIKIMCPSF